MLGAIYFEAFLLPMLMGFFYVLRLFPGLTAATLEQPAVHTPYPLVIAVVLVLVVFLELEARKLIVVTVAKLIIELLMMVMRPLLKEVTLLSPLQGGLFDQAVPPQLVMQHQVIMEVASPLHLSMVSLARQLLFLAALQE